MCMLLQEDEILPLELNFPNIASVGGAITISFTKDTDNPFVHGVEDQGTGCRYDCVLLGTTKDIAVTLCRRHLPPSALPPHLPHFRYASVSPAARRTSLA